MTKIENLVSTFTSKTLGKASPNNACFHMSYALHLHLKNNRIENSLRNGLCENVHHFWITLEGNEEIIVDTTIRQFDFAKNMSAIYIGQKPSEYIENLNFNFANSSYDDKILNNWLSIFRLSHIYIEEEKITENDLYRLLQINIKAATIIYNEIEENLEIEAKKYKRYSDYFSGIKELLCRYKDEKQIREFSNIKGFNNLHLKVCGHTI